jgi:hypothetical protein
MSVADNVWGSAFGTLSLPYLHTMRLAAFANALPIPVIVHVALPCLIGFCR